MYIIQFETGVYSTAGDGDPARTLKLENAERFSCNIVARTKLDSILNNIKPFRKLPNAQVMWLDEISMNLTNVESSEKMKIIVFEWKGGEQDWVFAESIEDAKEFYIKHTGCENLQGCEVTIVPEKDWADNYLINASESEPDPNEEGYNEEDYFNGYKIIESFAQYAARNSITDLMATTEF